MEQRKRHLLNGLISAVFPAYCMVCDEPAESTLEYGVCRGCWGQLEYQTDAVCATCGVSLPSPETQQVWQDYKCGTCRLRKRIPFDLCRSVCRYNETMSEIIRFFKFEGMRRLAEPLAKILIDYCRLKPGLFADSVVVPVPISYRRYLVRGYNQSHLLAARMAKSLELDFQPGLLKRRKHRRPQSLQPVEKRKSNVRDAFSAGPGCKGKHVLLLDDILTSGATVEECSRQMKRAGATRVTVLTLARAEHGV